MGGLSITAAHGGVTTLLHYASVKPGMGLIDTLKKFKEEGSQKSCVDFGIHGALFDPSSRRKRFLKPSNSG